MIPFEVRDLGLVDYQAATKLQQELLEQVLQGLLPNTLLLLEHPATLTLGANFHKENLNFSEEWYRARGICVVPTDRGGDVTYHAPGQLVAYPIFLLPADRRDLHRWLRDLEETVIVALASFGLVGRRFPPHTGVWIGEKKICAMGIKVRKWVSMHGLALNCDNDLTPFEWIVPCGIRDYGVTSLSRELGRATAVEEVKPALIAGFRTVFG